MDRKVDVAINAYGKPLQTAVTLFSLMKHSGRHIDRIFFIQERRQPPNSDFKFIFDQLADHVVVYVPDYFLWTYPAKYFRPLLRIKSVRHSVRYQYAWETTDKPYLFITHNDVLYHADIVGHFLENIGQHIGVGQVGMCWNCSAHTADVCSGERYLTFRPSIAEYAELVRSYPEKRAKIHKRFAHKTSAWPLPECRLNEWACMINLGLARPVTMPHGGILPFGATMLDAGTEWFFQVHQLGYTVRHVSLAGYAHHGWASATASGFAAFFDRHVYEHGEEAARRMLDAQTHFQPFLR